MRFLECCKEVLSQESSLTRVSWQCPWKPVLAMATVATFLIVPEVSANFQPGWHFHGSGCQNSPYPEDQCSLQCYYEGPHNLSDCRTNGCYCAD